MPRAFSLATRSGTPRAIREIPFSQSLAKYHESNCEDKEILVSIDKIVNSSIQLRSKKELIENFIQTVNASTEVDSDWKAFVQEQMETDLSSLISEENLKPEETRLYLDHSFRDGALKTTGTDIDGIMQ